MVKSSRRVVKTTTTTSSSSGSTSTSKPTATEERLGMSLPSDLRNLPAEEVTAGQSLAAGQSIPSRTVVSSRGGRGGGGSSFAPAPTVREQALQQSLPAGERDLPAQSFANQPSRQESRFSVRGDDGGFTRQPTAKEQVLQMSLQEPTSALGKMESKQSFKENIFYENILSQQKAFESNPQSSQYGMSTPEGQTYFFFPDVGKAELASKEAFGALTFGEKATLTIRNAYVPKVAEMDISAQTPKTKEDKTFNLLGQGFSLRKIIGVGVSSPINVNPLGKTNFGVAQRQVSEDIVYGFTPKTKTELAITAASFGVGAAVGGGLRVGGAALRTGLPKAAPFIEKGLTFGGAVIAAPLVITQGARVYFSKGDLGITAGEMTREFGALGAGGYVGEKAGGRLVGFVRTRNLAESPVDVIAPEFRAGQQFPQIKRGQSARQLKAEFFEPVLPGEVAGVPRGFSARVQPLNKEIEKGQLRLIGGGKFAELQGGFYAPRVNPSFLRSETGYPKLFSIGEFGKLPSIERTTFAEIIYAPGVRGGQRYLRRSFTVKEAEVYSKDVAGTGKAILPFTKSEKEVILAYETPVRDLNKPRFYQKDPISGERVPIFEREVVPNKEFKGFTKNVKKAGEVIKPSVSEYSLITPTRLGSYSLLGRSSSSVYNIPSSSSYVKSVSSSYSAPSSSSIISTPSSSYGRSYSRLSSSSSYSSLSSYSSYSSSTSKLFIPGIPPLNFDERKKRKRGDRGFVQTPSFGVAIAKEFKLNLGGFGKGLKSQSGLFERKFKTGVKLPRVI